MNNNIWQQLKLNYTIEKVWGYGTDGKLYATLPTELQRLIELHWKKNETHTINIALT
jgi:hypothetical protein